MAEDLKLPCKKHFRQRAHSNPLGDHNVEYPISPDTMNWENHFPKYFGNTASLKVTEVAPRVLTISRYLFRF